jgi:hypothetical protein
MTARAAPLASDFGQSTTASRYSRQIHACQGATAPKRLCLEPISHFRLIPPLFARETLSETRFE